MNLFQKTLRKKIEKEVLKREKINPPIFKNLLDRIKI
jgi:hypothetical protein